MDSFTKIVGPTGAFINVIKINSTCYLADPDFHGDIENVHSGFEARADDVIICSFPKAGLHWVWEIATMLNRNSAVPAQYLMEHRMFEALPARVMKRIPSPRILATHARPDQLPSSVLQSGVKLIYILRDPRAVAVSFYHHLSKLTPPAKFNGNWKDFTYFFNNGLIPFGSWFRHTRLWLNFIKENAARYPIHVMHYEDLVKDPAAAVQRLSKALGLSADAELIDEIVKATSFDKLKPVKEKLAEKLLTADVRKKWENEKWSIYRKGAIDDWKCYYSVRENENFLKLTDNELKGFDLKLKSSL